MKHCPACNFSFPDFHKVCDFDGTELVPDPERPVLVDAPRFRSRIQCVLKSPVVWAAGLLMFVLGSAFLVAYLEATVQSPEFVKAEPSPASSVNASSAATISDDPSSPSKPKVRKRTSASHNSLKPLAIKARRQPSIARSAPRREQETTTARSQRTETATRTKAQPERNAVRQVSEDKDPKVVAALKTTWRVLKKPFKF